MDEKQTQILTLTTTEGNFVFYQQYGNLCMRITCNRMLDKVMVNDWRNPLGTIIKTIDEICDIVDDYNIKCINNEFLPYLLQELEDGQYKYSSAKKAIIEYAKKHEEKENES